MFSLTPEEWTAVELSLRISLIATVVALPFGLAIAWLLDAGRKPVSSSAIAVTDAGSVTQAG